MSRRPHAPVSASRLAALLLGLSLLAAPRSAPAHAVELGIERGPEGVLARARYGNGQPLAGARFEVYGPAPGEGPRASGRADEAGRFAFSTDAPGAWRVRVIDAGGHGLERTLEVAEDGRVTLLGHAAGHAHGATGSILRPLLGVALLGLVFGGLWRFYRRRGGAPRGGP